jgi:hypothetical protein
VIAFCNIINRRPRKDGDMKESKSIPMQKALVRAVRTWRKNSRKIPSDGGLYSIESWAAKNGWYYQADVVHDHRFTPACRVCVYAFRPPRTYCAKSADLVIEKVIPCCESRRKK